MDFLEQRGEKPGFFRIRGAKEQLGLEYLEGRGTEIAGDGASSRFFASIEFTRKKDCNAEGNREGLEEDWMQEEEEDEEERQKPRQGRNKVRNQSGSVY